MMMVFLGFARLINDLGFGASLVQAKEINASHFSSIFFVNISIGLFLTCIVWFSAPGLAWFFEEPRLTSLAKWMSASFFIGSLGIVQRAKLMRNMQFDLLSVVELSSIFLGGIAAISFAHFGWSAHSIVIQYLVVAIVANGALWMLSSWRPHMNEFSWTSVKELFGFSSGLFGANTFSYLIRNSDNLIVGKFAGTGALGIYTRAYSTMLLPVHQIGRVMTRVMFPAFSKIQDNRQKIKSVYLRIVGTISMFMFPAMLGLCAVAPEFVRSIYGEKWIEVVPILRVLCLVGMVQSINTTVSWIYTSQGRTDLQFYWTLANGIVMIPMFLIGIQWGVMGVAIAYAIRVYTALYWNFSIPGKLIDLRASEVFSAITPQLLISVAMASIVWLVSNAIPDAWPPFAKLGLLVFTGVVLYGSLTFALKTRSFQDLFSLSADFLKNRVAS